MKVLFKVILVFIFQVGTTYIVTAQKSDTSKVDVFLNPDGVCSSMPYDSTSYPGFYTLARNCDSVVFVEVQPIKHVKGKREYYSFRSVIRDTLVKERIQPVQSLNEASIDSIYYILYNHSHADSETLCYNPRHGVAFYQENEIIAFLEICFECNQMYSWGALKVDDPNLCEVRRKVLAKALGVKLDH